MHSPFRILSEPKICFHEIDMKRADYQAVTFD